MGSQSVGFQKSLSWTLLNASIILIEIISRQVRSYG